MAYSIWDKQPELVLPKIPFEFLAGLAEKRDKQLDKLDVEIGQTKGAFAALQAAPGHEDLAQGLTKNYLGELNALTEKYKNNYTSRDFTRELTALSTKFTNDPGVKTVVNSKEWYDKNGAALWEARTKNYVINSPVLEKDGNFKQNTNPYSFDTFRMTPWADTVKEIQEQFNIQKEAKIKELDLVKEVQPDGTIKYFNRDRSKTYKDDDILAPVIQSTLEMLLQNSDSKPGFTYWNAKHADLTPEQKFEEALKLVQTSAEPFKFLQTEESVSKPTESKDSTTGTGSTDSKNITFGTATTIALDAIKDLNGKRITSTQGLQIALQESNKAVEANRGAILETFPELTDNDFTVTTSGYQLDLSKIKDSQQRSKAAELNARYVNSQRIRDSYEEHMHYFMDISGYDPDKPIEQQVDFSKFSTASQAASLAVGVAPQLMSSTGLARQGEVYSGQRGFKNRDEFYQFVTATYGESTPESLQKLKEWDTAYMEALRNIDPKYADYTEKVENYLNSTVYRQARNVNVNTAQLGDLKNAVGSALGARKITRANFGPEGGNRSQFLSAEEMESVLANNDIWEKGSYSIRLDESTNELVVDVSHGGEVYEIAGVTGLQGYVSKVDPSMSAEFLQRNDTFLEGLKSTNGRSTQVILYQPVMTSVGPSQTILATPKVKTVLETLPGVVEKGNYLTKFPGLNSENVIVAKSYWDLARLTESYNELLKVPGLKGDELQKQINNLFANPGEGIEIINGSMGKINSRYFPGYGASPLVLKEAAITKPSSDVGKAIVENALKKEARIFNSPSYGVPQPSAQPPQAGQTTQAPKSNQAQALPPNYNGLKSLVQAYEASSYDTLFGNAETNNDKFKNVKVSTMTIDQLKDFTKTGGEYDIYSKVKRKSAKKATPLGQYQIVGDTLKYLQKALNLPGDTVFSKDVQDMMFAKLVEDALQGTTTEQQKISRLRKVWEGFNKASDQELLEAIKQYES